MATFESYRSYWNFAYTIRVKSRYAILPEVTDFLSRLGKRLDDDPALLQKGTKLCRAQLGNDYEPLEDDKGEAVDQMPCAFGPARMKPLSDRAKEGRVNPRGIPCLYLSTDRETSISEVRPSKGQFVSLGYFEAIKDCRLANFTVERNRKIVYFAEPPDDKIDNLVLGDLADAFSRPVEIDDSTAEYAPTQVIAEYVRKLGYDGIHYRSDLGPGMNIALFDLDAADLRACDLYMIDGIKYSFFQADNTYFVKSGGTPGSAGEPSGPNEGVE